MNDKKLVYIISGSDESKVVYEHMGKFLDVPEKPVLLSDYEHKQDELPILITGSGREHSLSYVLSKKMDNHFEKSELVKVMYDQHDDNAESDKLFAGTHLYHVKKEGLVSEIYINGVNERLVNPPRYPVCEPAGENYEKRKEYLKKLEQSKKAIELKNKKIHLTVDFDYLWADYVDHAWQPMHFENKRLIKEKLEDMHKQLKQIAENNEIIAIDLTGVAPYFSWHKEGDKFFTYNMARLDEKDLKECDNLVNQIARLNRYKGDFVKYSPSNFPQEETEEIPVKKEELKVSPATDMGAEHYAETIKTVLGLA